MSSSPLPLRIQELYNSLAELLDTCDISEQLKTDKLLMFATVGEI